MFCQSFVLFVTISLSTCLPQLNEGPYSYWRNKPRSIPSNAYYSNHPATYQDPQEITRNGYRTEYASYVDSRARGPTARTDEKEVRIMNYPAERGDVMYGDQTSDFFFPGNVHNSRSEVSTKKPTPKPTDPPKKNPYLPDIDAITKNCKGYTFCESIDDYPKDHVRIVLKDEAAKFEDAFGVDELDVTNITTRIGVEDGSEGDPMCKATERVITPPAAKNANNEWKFIVNDADKYIQGIRVELCQNPGEKCAMSQNFPLSYETECKQKYIFRKLLALDSSGEVQADNFRLPSCCVCVYRAKRLSRSPFGLK